MKLRLAAALIALFLCAGCAQSDDPNRPARTMTDRQLLDIDTQDEDSELGFR